MDKGLLSDLTCTAEVAHSTQELEGRRRRTCAGFKPYQRAVEIGEGIEGV